MDDTVDLTKGSDEGSGGGGRMHRLAAGVMAALASKLPRARGWSNLIQMS
jgi:hypothetical protein